MAHGFTSKAKISGVPSPEAEPYAGFDAALIAGLKRLDPIVIDGDYDVFGDGSALILSSHGHTPGFYD